MESRGRSLALVGIVILATVLLGSCGMILGFIFPDQIEVDGASYEISKLYVINYGLNSDGNYDLFVWLVSDGLSATAANSWSGTGDEIGFWLNTSTPSLPENTFSYNPSSVTKVAGTIWTGVVKLGFSVNTGNSTAEYTITGGELDVRKALVGDAYIIEFHDGVTAAGQQINARFRGPMEIAVIQSSFSELSEHPLVKAE